jgi:hypothetical protein
MFLIFFGKDLVLRGLYKACRVDLIWVNNLKLKGLSWFWVRRKSGGRRDLEHF